MGATIVLALLYVLVGAASTGASSSGLVISQVYGGGGNAGATLKNDFIEVFNAGSSTADLTGWSVQYASAVGTSWQTTNLSGSLAPGQYLLVQEAAGTGGTVDLPPPDVTGTIAMSATSGKVALVNGTTALTGACPTGTEDFVGYGTTANCFEGIAPAASLQNTTAALRLFDGCTDTNSNSFDFQAGAPNPRNRLSALHFCTGDNPPTITAITPVAGASGVPVDSNLTVTFSEPVDVAAGWFLITCLASGAHQATVTGGPTTFTIDPNANFAGSETCSVGIDGSHISDQDTDDPPDNLPGNPSWSFTTGAAPVPPLVVVSQVYGGGGNSGATYKNDFIELYNRGSGLVSLNGWSVQYASAAGTTWQVTNLSNFSLQAGQHYLVQEAQGAGGTLNLPPPDATGTIAMSATAGKVALVNSTTPLSGACPTGGAIVDFVGYGTTANCFEGSGPTAAPSNTTAALRKAAGATDTNDNAADFEIGAPNPRGTGDAPPAVVSRNPGSGAANVAVDSNVTIGFSEPVNVTGSWYSLSCTTSGDHTATVSGDGTSFTLDPDTDFASAETCTVTVLAANVSDQDTNDPPDNMAGDDTWSFSTVAPPVAIHDIQGAAHISPLDGQNVSNVNGIVTAKRSNGFYMQDPSPDSNDATSEGIFVFTSSAPAANVGDSVNVSGHVQEFRPGGASSTNLTTTELTTPTISILSTGNTLPDTTVLGTGGRIPPNQIIEDDAGGDVETGGVFDPATDGIDFYESVEGMRVQVNDAVAVGPTKFGETPIVGDGGANAGVRTIRGGVLLREDDANPERVVADDAIVPMPDLNVGDGYSGPIVGVMDYGFGNFFIEVTNPVSRVDNGLQREVTVPAATNELSVATFNFENLDPTDPQSKFDQLAGMIVNNLRSPDLIGGEEVQDNTGPANDGIVAANQTLAQLVAAIQAAGGPTYDWREIDPVNNQDGGEPGGNIRQVFLFRTDRGLSFVDRPGGTSTDPTGVTGTGSSTQLTFSPGRIDPANAAWSTSRKPLAGEFLFHGTHVFAIVNHFNSKGGDQPLMGHFQPPTRSSETQRHQQAHLVADFVSQLTTADPNANVVVLGDLNDFEFSETVGILEAAGLHDLMNTLPLNQRYSYEFEGNAQVLDHIMFSGALFGRPFVFDPVHVNAEFWDQASDHDPSVVRVTLNSPPTAGAGGPYTVAEGGSVSLSASGSDPEGGPLTYAWDLDNDGVFETAGQSATFSAAALDGPSSHAVTVQVTDDGGLTATDTTTVSVTNIAPTATFAAPASAPAGSPFTLSLSSPHDPSDADTVAGFTYAFDCGSGYGGFGPASSASCPTSDTGSRSVGGKIRDKDGGVTEYRATVNVVVTYASLCELVHRLVTDPTVAAALCDKLNAAAAAAARGNDGAKENQLQAFRSQLDAQTGKSVSAADADLLKRLSTRL
jgi:uncharacterized protein